MLPYCHIRSFPRWRTKYPRRIRGNTLNGVCRPIVMVPLVQQLFSVDIPNSDNNSNNSFSPPTDILCKRANILPHYFQCHLALNINPVAKWHSTSSTYHYRHMNHSINHPSQYRRFRQTPHRHITHKPSIFKHNNWGSRPSTTACSAFLLTREQLDQSYQLSEHIRPHNQRVLPLHKLPINNYS